MTNKKITVIGAGLAGVEAAWQISKRGYKVDLYEMRPKKMTPVHKTANYAELVCSNSLKAIRKGSAAGMLKEEMKLLGSLLMECAEQCKVPAGGALAVDREKFSALVTEKIGSNENINVILSSKNDDIITKLYNSGFGVTKVEVSGKNNSSYMLYITIKGNDLEKLKSIISKLDKNAFFVVNETQFVKNGYFNIIK